MEKLFAEKLWIVPWSVLALAAIVIALVFLFLDTTGAASGPRWFVVRWFHSICWLLLALAAVIKARVTPVPEELAVPLAVAGGACYAAFLVASFVWK
jgi:hypothetical protein